MPLPSRPVGSRPAANRSAVDHFSTPPLKVVTRESLAVRTPQAQVLAQATMKPNCGLSQRAGLREAMFFQKRHGQRDTFIRMFQRQEVS